MTDAASFTLRPALADDREFLLRVYSGSREEELSVVEWPEGEKERFLRQQFEAQDTYYRAQYEGAEFLVIEVEGKPAGRLYLHRNEDDIRIVDVALLPEFRGRGAGAQILREILSDAEKTNRPVTIHVERWNRALHLYDRLGFKLKEDRGVYLFLEWRAS